MAEEVISKKKSSLKDEWKSLEEKLRTMIAELEDLGSCLDHFFYKNGPFPASFSLFSSFNAIDSKTNKCPM